MTIFYHDDYSQLTQTPNHPESPERIFAILEKLAEIFPGTDLSPTGPATEEQLALAHDEKYIELIKNHGGGFMDADSFIHEHTYEMARLAAGGAIDAMNWSMENEKASMLLARPPGHHAGADYGGGFCYFNNAAIAAARAAGTGKKVAIIDTDVHHGNGTNDIFRRNPNVLFISTHQWGIYPGTGPPDDVGDDEGQGFNINVAIPGRAGDSSFELAYDKIIMPILHEFKPEALVISLGCDAHYRDPLAGLTLSTPGYLSIMDKLLKFGDSQCANRTMITLEGGYDTPALAEVVVGTYAKMTGRMFETEFNEVSDDEEIGADYITLAHGILKEYWKLE